MKNRKGILLAGGTGSRLFPVTHVISKQLLPVYDKPMIYYPLSVLMLSGIREILIISTSEDTPRFQELLGDGSHLGLQISYAIQKKPEGIAQSFLIAKDFIQDHPVSLVLGDNIFYGNDLFQILQKANQSQNALIFGYHVQDPQRYGVVQFDQEKNVVSIEEKPDRPKSHFAIPGLYFYDENVYEYAASLKPSKRNELEITDLHQIYLQKGKLQVQLLGRGHAWLDTGTFASLHEAAGFIEIVQKRQGIKIACIEEIAYRLNYIDENQLLTLADTYKNNEYGQYLKQCIEESSLLPLFSES
jgi:glucose-1-phosphate thymidylyltransferase